MLQLPASPVQESLAVIGEQSFELLGVVYLDAYGLRLACNIEVHERQLNLLQGPCAAQKSSVDPQLRPMQGTMALGNSLHGAPVGLEFLQPIRGRVVAIGTAAYAQLAVVALERDLCLIAWPTAACEHGMTFDALAGTGSGREAQIEIAGFRRELTQGAHSDGVRHAALDRGVECSHETLQTATSMPTVTQKPSQR